MSAAETGGGGGAVTEMKMVQNLKHVSRLNTVF